MAFKKDVACDGKLRKKEFVTNFWIRDKNVPICTGRFLSHG